MSGSPGGAYGSGYDLGVDFGTTFTAAAVQRDGRVDVAHLGDRAAAVPSVLYAGEDGGWLFGEPANRRGLGSPERVAREFKRRIGDPAPIILGGSPYSADALAAKLLAWVVSTVSAQQGGPPANITLTYPARWGPYKQDLLRQAADRAGLGTVTLRSEPEAAALSYASAARVGAGHHDRRLRPRRRHVRRHRAAQDGRRLRDAGRAPGHRAPRRHRLRRGRLRPRPQGARRRARRGRPGGPRASLRRWRGCGPSASRRRRRCPRTPRPPSP